MFISQEHLTRQIKELNDEQLKQVSEFINFLKFKERSTNLKLDEAEMAQFYQEFAEEDKQLAEIGMDEYVEALSQEDSQ
ncbi:MAG: hypothetical protein QNJ72_37860 [Pleurocapsa sp. MO_226.B13]|nr:hypothetical protein [Pleurocapsa sp. MO_226.B13]